MFKYVAIKHKQMSFVSNGGKFKLYTVLNGLIFPTPTQPRISFERAILYKAFIVFRYLKIKSGIQVGILLHNLKDKSVIAFFVHI
jgi:hypothetical protein